jgi:hypothetical protein
MLGVATNTRSLLPMLGWLGAIMLVVVLGGVCILLYRRQVLGRESASAMQSGVFDELREMRDRGQITSEEFEEMKARIVARVAGRPLPPRIERPSVRFADERRAAPGFDLTGAPLPRPKDDEPRAE